MTPLRTRQILPGVTITFLSGVSGRKVRVTSGFFIAQTGKQVKVSEISFSYWLFLSFLFLFWLLLFVLSFLLKGLIMWVKCSERLPNKYDWVFAYTALDGIIPDMFIDESEQWISGTYRWSGADVTHWHPELEPPEN